MTPRRFLTLAGLLCAIALLAACNRPSTPTVEPPDEPAPAEPQSADHDACLEGDWWMETHDLDILVSTLSPTPNLRVPDGNLLMMFDPDGQYEYQGRVILHMDMDPSQNQYMETTAFFTTSGPYSSQDDSTLVLDLSNSRREVIEMIACEKGECYSTEVMPVFDIVPPGSAPYRCTGERLEIDSQGPFGPVTMFFYR